jgi:hypothetical protein
MATKGGEGGKRGRRPQADLGGTGRPMILGILQSFPLVSEATPLSPLLPLVRRRLRLIGAAAALLVLLAGCASSPEAARVRGEPGADPGNHGNPVVLLAPPERVDRVFYDVPYDGPAAASEDTSQS